MAAVVLVVGPAQRRAWTTATAAAQIGAGVISYGAACRFCTRAAQGHSMSSSWRPRKLPRDRCDTPTREAPGDTRRLLWITYDFGPSGPVGGLRWRASQSTCRLGWTISVVTAAPRRAYRGDRARRWSGVPRLGRWPTATGCYAADLRGSLGLSRNVSALRRGGRRGLLRQLRNEVRHVLAFRTRGNGWISEQRCARGQ